jgi:hypothetical protein
MTISATSRRPESRIRQLRSLKPSPMFLSSLIPCLESHAMRLLKSRMLDSFRRLLLPRLRKMLIGRYGTCCSVGALLFLGLQSRSALSLVGMGLWRLASAGRRVLLRMGLSITSDKRSGSTLRSINFRPRQEDLGLIHLSLPRREYPLAGVYCIISVNLSNC